jgi:hypothetical protein
LKTSKFIFIILLLVLAFQTHSQRLTSHADISLLTCSPGTQELYAHFGHSAIRVKDTTTNTDIVFNYGVFDFDTPNFYWKFVKGKLKYQLAVHSTFRFLQVYNSEGREVKEEKLILTEKEKLEILDYLNWNYQPENRYYLYDFFYNNCSSKIWDLVKLKLHTAYVFDKSDYEALTFRQMLHEYLENARWAQFGIDLALGLPADEVADFEEQMFLPDYLSENMSHVKRTEPLAGNSFIMAKEQVLIPKQEVKKEGFLKDTLFDSPKAMAWVLFFHILGFSLIMGLSFKRWFDLVYFSILGLLGLLLVFLWFGTDHGAMNANLNILWASPLALIFVYFRIKKHFKAMNVLGIVMTATALITLLGWDLIPQQFHPAVIPLALLIPLRVLDNLFMYQYNFTLSSKIRVLIGRDID